MGEINSNPPKRRRVGLIYDERMCKHNTPDEECHPENPNRIRAVWDKLNESGLVQRCVVLNAKNAEDDQLALVHSKHHIELIKTVSSTDVVPRFNKIASKYDSIYFNEGSSEAANLAAGSVIKAAVKVAKGELDSAFAIVRPPGHHAEENEPMGFCLYNNVAIAASYLLNKRPELGISKILIVDWDVHHGNSTQKMFYKDPRVLFFSVHRHENGSFYPYGNDGSHIMTGEGPGAGYNINVPWDNGWCGDSDYLAVWDHILIPVAKKFDPDMIIISAGFDAAISDPIGGCCVSPDGYSIMLDKLMDFARGKIVMALEGGYNPTWLAHSAQACVEVLLQDKSRTISLKDSPLMSTCRVIKTVREALCAYWPVLAGEVIDRTSQVEIEIGFRHATNQTSDSQANAEVGIDNSAANKVHLKGKVNSLDDQKSLSSSSSRARPVGGDRTGPEPYVPATQPRENRVPPANKDPVSAPLTVQPTQTDESSLIDRFHAIAEQNKATFEKKSPKELKKMLPTEVKYTAEQQRQLTSLEVNTDLTGKPVRTGSKSLASGPQPRDDRLYSDDEPSFDDDEPPLAVRFMTSKRARLDVPAGKVNSVDEQKRGSSSTSRAQPVGDRTGPEPYVSATQPRGNRVPPTNKDPVSAHAADISKAPPIASYPTPSKRSNSLTLGDLKFLFESSPHKSLASSSQPEGAQPPHDAPLTAASSITSKRARLNVPAGNSGPGQSGPHIPLSRSLRNQVRSFLDDDDFTWDRETVQRLVNEENVDVLKEMSLDDLTHASYTSLVYVLNITRIMSKKGRCHEGRATELEKKLKSSEDEVARLRNENKKLSAACDKAEKSLDHEITTGQKFLKSEAGKQRLKEAKKDGVDEFKKSEAFRNEVLNAAENVYDEAIKACRQMAFPR